APSSVGTLPPAIGSTAIEIVPPVNTTATRGIARPRSLPGDRRGNGPGLSGPPDGRLPRRTVRQLLRDRWAGAGRQPPQRDGHGGEPDRAEQPRADRPAAALDEPERTPVLAGLPAQRVPGESGADPEVHRGQAVGRAQPAAYGATEGRAEEDRRRRELRRVEREVGPGGRREMRAAEDRSAVLERPSDRSLGPPVPLAQQVG